MRRAVLLAAVLSACTLSLRAQTGHSPTAPPQPSPAIAPVPAPVPPRQTPVTPPVCNNYFAAPELQLAVPIPTGAAPVPPMQDVRWWMDDSLLEDTGREIKLAVTPAAQGTFNLKAATPAGDVLCGVTVTLHLGASPEREPLGAPTEEQQAAAEAAGREEALRDAQQKIVQAQAAVESATARQAEAARHLDQTKLQVQDKLAKALASNHAAVAPDDLRAAAEAQLAAPRQELAEANNAVAAAQNELATAQDLALIRGQVTASSPTGGAGPQPGDVVHMIVYYVTERTFGSSGSAPDFTDVAGQLHYGRVTVLLPRTRPLHHFLNRTFYTFEIGSYQVAQNSWLSFGSRSDFFTSIQSLNTSRGLGNNNVLVFVHGYNNGFLEDIYKTAQLAYDTGFRGQAILFDWPSRDRLIDYSYDVTAALNAQPDLVDFLRALQSGTQATSVSLVAHSLGSRLLMRTLDTLRRDPNPPHFKEVILAAPDIEKVDLLPLLAGTPPPLKLWDRFTLYGARQDLAMGASFLKNHFMTAAGHLPPFLNVSSINQVDASDVPMSLPFHDYFITTQPTLDDITYLLNSPGDADVRRRARALPQPGQWVLER